MCLGQISEISSSFFYFILKVCNCKVTFECDLGKNGSVRIILDNKREGSARISATNGTQYPVLSNTTLTNLKEPMKKKSKGSLNYGSSLDYNNATSLSANVSHKLSSHGSSDYSLNVCLLYLSWIFI